MSYEEYEGDWELEWDTARAERDKYADSAIGTRGLSHVMWDSPAEVDFAAIAIKYFAADVSFSPGRRIPAQSGAFRPDIVLAQNGRVIGLEIDGRDFHKDKCADQLRESLLLAGRFVHVIYRFAASATWYQAEDCVYALSKYERPFFDKRALECVLPRLVSRRVLAIEEWPSEGVHIYLEPSTCGFDGGDDSIPQPSHFNVYRRTLDNVTINRTASWVEKVIQRHGHLSFEKLLTMYRAAVLKAS